MSSDVAIETPAPGSHPLLQKLSAFWFTAFAPSRLGAVRVVTGLYALWFFQMRHRLWMISARQPADTFHGTGITAYLDGPLAPESFELCVIALRVLAVLFTLGLLYRVTAPLFAVLTLFVLTYATSWSMIYHTENMFCLHLMVLCLTPAAGALSVDALLRRLRLPGALHALMAERLGPEPSVATGWPIRLLSLCATLPYTVAGVAKLREGGLAWALGDNLRDQIAMNGLYYELFSGGTAPITFEIYGWERAFAVLATGTLFLELGAPLALLHPLAGYLFVVSVVSMHWGILWLMGIEFPYQMYGVAFACFIPWDALFARVRSWLGGRRLTLFRLSARRQA
jgi:hypothetical protein